MKKKLIIVFFIIIFFLVDAMIVSPSDEIKEQEIRFVYISYLEYLNNFKGNSVTINKSKIDKMIDEINFYRFNTIILHVSPFSDAIYNSKYFPYSYTLTGVEGKNPGFDYLEYFIKKAHLKDIKVHAWLNPYRISSQNNISVLSNDNPVKKFLNTNTIGISDQGIYYNPCSEEVKVLLENQVNELISNYKLDGIHLDDYFYIDYDIDKENYEEYLINGGKLSIKEFRLMHTNDLVRRIGELINRKNSDLIFSIAPDGNINNNYNYHYADVKTWIKEQYVDIIMPQIYYGYNNQYLPFEKAYNSWYSLIKDSQSKVKIVPVLAFYKVGQIDNGAGSGKNEWLENGIISQQINFLKNRSEYFGFGLFRYDFLFNKSVTNNIGENELKLIRQIM